MHYQQRLKVNRISTLTSFILCSKSLLFGEKDGCQEGIPAASVIINSNFISQYHQVKDSDGNKISQYIRSLVLLGVTLIFIQELHILDIQPLGSKFVLLLLGVTTAGCPHALQSPLKMQCKPVRPVFCTQASHLAQHLKVLVTPNTKNEEVRTRRQEGFKEDS